MEYDGSKRFAAVVRCAEILYPANSDSLLEEVTARLSQRSSSITTTDENRVTENTIMIKKASEKRSIQARVARAIFGEETSRSSHTIFEEGRCFHSRWFFSRPSTERFQSDGSWNVSV